MLHGDAAATAMAAAASRLLVEKLVAENAGFPAVCEAVFLDRGTMRGRHRLSLHSTGRAHSRGWHENWSFRSQKLQPRSSASVHSWRASSQHSESVKMHIGGMHSNHNVPSADGLTLVQPFPGMTSGEIAAMIDAEAGAARASLVDLLARLGDLLTRHQPLDVLAHFAYYGRTTQDGTNEREFTEVEPVHQHHVELLQALALRHAPRSFGGHLLRPADAGDIFSAVRSFDRAVRVGRGRGVSGTADAGAREILAEAARGETQAVRVPGFPHLTVDILSALFAPLEADIERAHGVRVKGLLGVWAFVGSAVEARLSAHMRRCRPFHLAVRRGDLQGALDAFRVAFPSGQASEAPAIARDLLRNGSDADTLRGLLQTFADIELWHAFVIDLSECVAAYETSLDMAADACEAAHDDAPATTAGTPRSPVDPAALARVLDRWTLGFGDLAPDDPAQFSLANPVWRRPLVRIGDGTWFCALPTLFFSFPFELLDMLIEKGAAAAARVTVRDGGPSPLAPRADLRQRYEARRAAYLESEVARRLASALPGATLVRGATWRDPHDGRIYENDVLVLQDQHALVVEAKSGAVSDPARRGAPQRLQRTVRDLISDAVTQAGRFARHLGRLAREEGPHHIQTRAGATHVVELPEDMQIIPLVITLDHLNLAGFGGRTLVDAGWLPEDVGAVPIINLWDLRAVLEVLEGPIDVLHYMARRADFESEARYQGYEMDLLGYYFDRALLLGPVEDALGRPCEGDVFLNLLGYSRVVSPYLVAASVPHLVGQVERPRARRTPWFAALVDALAQRRARGWTRHVEMLLNVPVEGQRALEDAVLALRESRSRENASSTATASTRAEVKHVVAQGDSWDADRGRGGAPANPRYAAVVHGPQHRRAVVIAVDLPEPTLKQRRQAFLDAIGAATDRYPSYPVLGVGLDPRFSFVDEPYRMLAQVAGGAVDGRGPGGTA